MEDLYRIGLFFGGLLTTGAAVLSLYGAISIWSSGLWLLLKPFVSLLLIIAGIVYIDTGLGMATRGDNAAFPVVIDSKVPSQRLFLLFHGYNGNGESLAELLQPALEPHGTILAFRPSSKGYYDKQVVGLALRIIARHHPSEITAYSESSGGMTLANLLREQSDLHLKGAVLNASPDRASNVNINIGGVKFDGDWTMAANFVHGGPILIDPTAAGAARHIANFKPPAKDEFYGRVEMVRFIHAPGEEDDFVKNALSSLGWRFAFGENYEDVPMNNWNVGEHAPTPARAADVAAQILAVAGVRVG